VAGLIAGTLEDDDVVRGPQPADGYFLLTADFHVHAFFGDLGLAPWDLQQEATRRGLDVIAVTNHIGVAGGKLNREWSTRRGGPIILVGQEITSSQYHLIAAGIEHAISARQPAAAAIRAVHEQGGIAIAAHPVRAYWNAFDHEALALLDGVEAAHPTMYSSREDRSDLEMFYRRAKEQNADVAAIGSSDFHVIAPLLGVCRTYVFAQEYSEQGVLDAVRHGRTVAMDRDGMLYGDPLLVRLVERQLARGDRDAPRSRGQSSLQRLALTSAWLGLIGAIILRGRRGRP
jgi:predicted metal-dependent phosphoesterase TrpH